MIIFRLIFALLAMIPMLIGAAVCASFVGAGFYVVGLVLYHAASV